MSADGTCTHWWIIAPPNGPVSLGKCRYCHASKMFQNYSEDRPFKSRHIIAPLDEKSDDLISRLINGELESIHAVRTF